MMIALAITDKKILLMNWGDSLKGGISHRQFEVKDEYDRYRWENTCVFVKYETFTAIIYQHRVKTKSWMIFLYMKIFKADFFSENNSLWHPLQESVFKSLVYFTWFFFVFFFQ